MAASNLKAQESLNDLNHLINGASLISHALEREAQSVIGTTGQCDKKMSGFGNLSSIICCLTEQIDKLSKKSADLPKLVAVENIPETYREHGYVNWNTTHNFLKTIEWYQSIDAFTRVMGNKKQDLPCDIKFESFNRYYVNEITRFPMFSEMPYVNISDPRLMAETSYLLNVYSIHDADATDFIKDYWALVVSKAFTRSSFEEKYGLVWVDKSK